MTVFICFWIVAGAVRWLYHFNQSLAPTFWQGFSSAEREYFQRNIWLFDMLGLLWSMLTGLLYYFVDLWRYLRRTNKR